MYTVRLVNGSTQYEGRVEVLYNGEWGTVCDDGWDLIDASIVCRQLGFGPAIVVPFYGEGTGHIWLEDVNCTGTEFIIEDCSHSGWGSKCNHGEDAGAKCLNRNDESI